MKKFIAGLSLTAAGLLFIQGGIVLAGIIPVIIGTVLVAMSRSGEEGSDDADSVAGGSPEPA